MRRPGLRQWIVVCLLVSLSLTLAGCWSNREPDDLAYILAIGLDKGQENRLIATFLIANPGAMGSGVQSGGGGSGGAQERSIITAVEAPGLYVALDMINSYIGRRITLMHTKLILFSEEMARDGTMGRFAAGLSQYREARRTMFIGVARGSAQAVIQEIKPLLETNPSKYLELVMNNGKFTGLSPAVLYHEFYTELKNTGANPVANLLSVSQEKRQGKEAAVPRSGTGNEALPQSGGEPSGGSGQPSGGGTAADGQRSGEAGKFITEGAYPAGFLPRHGGVALESLGAAAFAGPKMVGEMNGDETTVWNMFKGRFLRAVFSLPDPSAPNNSIAILVTVGRRPNIKVRFEGKKPVVEAKLTLEGDLVGIQSLINYQKPEKQPILEKAMAERVRKDAEKLVARSQREFRSDIFGFGKKARRLFWTEDQWKALDWDKIYPEAKVKITVEFKLRRSGALLKLMPIRGPVTGGVEEENR